MDRFLAIDAFVRVAGARSFAEAARQMRVSRSVVTARIKQLEAFVGAPLFHRNTRSVRLSDLGQTFLRDCTELVGRTNEVVDQMRDASTSPGGTWVGNTLSSAWPVTNNTYLNANVPSVSAGETLLETAFAALVLAAMAFLQLMAPNLAQAAAFKKEWHDAGRLDLYWLQRFWVMMSSGLQVRGPRHLDVWFPTLANLGEARPALRALIYGAMPVLTFAGIARALHRGGARERAVWVGLLGPIAFFFVHRELQNFFILPRFVIFALPAFVCLPMVGLEGLLRSVARGRRGVVAVGLALSLAGFGFLVEPALRVLWTHPATPSRELVALLYGVEKASP